MKAFLNISAATLMLGFAVLVFPQSETPAEDLSRLAVLDLEYGRATPVQAAAMSGQVREALKRTGRYYVPSAGEMARHLQFMEETIPGECHTEQCVFNAGQSLAVSKVIVGGIDRDQALTILKLKSFDLETRRFEAKAVVASPCGEAQWNELASAGVSKLLGTAPQDLSIELVEPRGREVNNRKEWYIMAGATVAAALIWGAANGAIWPSGERNANIPEIPDHGITNLSYQVGAFADLIANARPHGMGGAFVGLSDDANAMACNPAGMVRVRGRNVTAGTLHQPFGTGFYSYGYSGYVNTITRTMAHGQALITSSGAGFGSSETQVITSFAKTLEGISRKAGPFSVGVNLKFLMFTASRATGDVYAWQDYAVEGGGFGASIDLGAQFSLSDRITAGLLLRDIVNTVRYTNTSTGGACLEGVPQALIIGGHYRILNTMDLVLDGRKSLWLDMDDHVRLGMEKRLFDVLALRIGMSQNFAMDSHRRYHFGLGLDWAFKKLKHRAGVDYSYEVFPLSGMETMGLSGDQRFALNYEF